MKSNRVTFVGTVAAVAIVSGAAWAAIPDSGGVFHGCYDNQSGQMRIIDIDTGEPKGCGKNETEVSWNQQGPKGDTGPQGPQGADGPTGATGATGAVGPAGPQGEKGEKGDPGLAGTSQAFRLFGRLSNVSSGGRGVVLSKSVPAGSYVLTASVFATGTGSDADEVAIVTCELKNGATRLAVAHETLGHFGSTFVGAGSLSLTGTFAPTATSTVTLECAQIQTDTVTFDGNLAMIKVDTIS